jgi:hypothetical protein
MLLNRIDDPRDNLGKARRYELGVWAEQNGHRNFSFMGKQWNAYEAPAEITREFLRSVRLVNIRIPDRPLGQPVPHPSASQDAPVVPSQIPSMGALAHLAAQDQVPAPVLEETPLKDMSINELRAEGKRLGVKFERTDNMPKMRDKIEAARNG